MKSNQVIEILRICLKALKDKSKKKMKYIQKSYKNKKK